jgi:hypothetical protein
MLPRVEAEPNRLVTIEGGLGPVESLLTAADTE